MSRAAQQKVYADFRQGFVTVANPLAYPEGSLKDIVNFDILDNGTVKLRPGLRQETSTVVDLGESLSSINNKAVSLHVWDNVENSGDERIAVVQVGTTLYFYPMLDSGIDLDNPSRSPLDLGIPLADQDKRISTASGSGWLFVAHPSISPFALKRSFGGINVVPITVKIRDTDVWEGSTDEETGYSSSTLYPIHEYNLRNAGWPYSCNVSNTSYPNDGTVVDDPVTYTNTKIGKYPRVSIPFSVAKAGGGDNLTKQTAYNPWAIENDYYGNSLIPRGKFIVNAASWQRFGSGDDFLTSDPLSNKIQRTYTWTQNPSAVEFYAGRVWYTGAKGYQEYTSFAPSYTKSDNLDVSNTLYFSQQISSDLNKVGRCYQENDPTAEDINQLLPTDGGTISIRGAGEILDIKTFGSALVVFSKQGIWAVSGTDANSFRADDVSVIKISNIGPSSKNTISSTNNFIYYIANDAMYVLTVDDVTGLPTPKDITSEKIKDFYTSISYKAKENSKAFFDVSNRNLYMFYIEEDNLDSSQTNVYYNKCLVYNQDLNAFYKYEIGINNNYIVDGLFYNKDTVVTLTSPVVRGTDVVVSGTDPVVLEETYSTASLNNVQLLTLVDNGTTVGFTISSFTDTDNRQDWGTDYTGYVEFGFDVAGDIMRDSLKTPVIIAHLDRTEDGFEINPSDPAGQELILTNSSSCLMSYGWDWATSYKNPIQIYRFNRHYVPSGSSDPFNYGVDVITTRNRIRGKGHSLGIRIDSEAGKACHLLGLGILYTQAQRI